MRPVPAKLFALAGNPGENPNMADFAAAFSLHQAGRVREAEQAYSALLAHAPDQPEVLHALGVLRHQTGNSASAADLLARAAALTPDRAEYQFNLGLALFRLGRLEEAEQHFQAAVTLKPEWPAAQYDLGNTLRALKRSDEAARAYRQALRLRPDFFEAQVNLGNALRDSGRADQAANAYRRAMRQRPDQAEVYNNLGAVLLDQGDMAEAEDCFRAALRLRPDFQEALTGLSKLLERQAKHGDLLPVLAALLRLRANDAALYERYANLLRDVKQTQAAIAAYEQALALAPARYSARFGRAEAYRQARDFAAARAELEQLVALRPDAWQAHHDLANVLRDIGDFAAAETHYRAALAITETAGALSHLGAVLRDLGRLDEAEQVLNRALALEPGLEDARYNLAITHLTAGRLAGGFEAYDARFAKFAATLPKGRRWAGENPAGKTILVHAEQGLGDTIQFARYLPILAARGARVIFHVQRVLLGLFDGLAGAENRLALDQKASKHDMHAAIMSLPHLLRDAHPAPIPIPYLFADPNRAEFWAARLASLPGPKIGLVWAGNPGFQADHLRSIPAAMLAPLADAQASLVSLQKNAATLPDLAMHDWTGELADMADTAALVANLDLVIAVDTAVAHLAGALGRPVWLLNRFDSCWRWQTETESSLWYPTMRQFRQTAPGDWAGTIARVRAALVAEERKNVLS